MNQSRRKFLKTFRLPFNKLYLSNLLICLIFFFFINLYILEGSTSWPASEEKISILKKSVEKNWKKLSGKEPKIKTMTRSLAKFALNAVAVNYPPERIEKILRFVEQQQDKDEKSRGYGNFFWYWGDTEVIDRNAVEFTTRHAVLILILYRDRLSPEAEKILMRILLLAVKGIQRHGVRLDYTNIILMKIWNLIALGEYLNLPKVADEGYNLFNAWLIYTYKNGIHEYLSPAYYAVDLENLALIYHLSQKKDVRSAAESALNYMWTDIMANWYKPGARLGGTHSRDYDRLFGHGNLDMHLVRAGFINNVSGKKIIEGPYEYFSFFQPPGKLSQYLTGQIPRFIFQRWGEHPFQMACHYIGRNFSVGSAGSCYKNMDKTPLVINIGKGPEVPVINFFMEGRGAYYGLKKIKQRSGHMKSLHLKPFITSVQNDAEVLFLASVADNTEGLTGIESVITIPSDSEIWMDNARLDIDPGRSIQIKIPKNVNIFIRREDVVAVLRLIKALNIFGKSIPFILHNDGIKHGVLRLTAVHAGHRTDKRALISVWSYTEENIDSNRKFEEFRNKIMAIKTAIKSAGSKYTLFSGGISSEMHLTADVEKEIRLERKGMKKYSEDHILSINGKDKGREILAAIPVIKNYLRDPKKDEIFIQQPDHTVHIEAEKGRLSFPMIFKKKGRIAYITVPNGSPWPLKGEAIYKFNISSPGEYIMQMRVIASNNKDDSAFISMDGGKQTTYDVRVSLDWAWDTVRERIDNENKKKIISIYTLGKGVHTLEIMQREDGLMIDAIMIRRKE